MPTLTDQPALDFLGRLFPGGLGDGELLAEACPEGWERSPLWLAYHPGPERRYEEHCLLLKKIDWLKRPDEPGPQIPTYEEFVAKEEALANTPVGPLEEWQELLGDCLFDVISDNHEIILANGERVNFGSFRMASALIDQFIRGGIMVDDWDCGDCMRFYMGTNFVRGRTDLSSVYRLIFRRLRSIDCRWHYSFPRIYAIRLAEHGETGDYDPSQGFAAEEERKQAEEDNRHQERLNADVAERKRKAWDKAPPNIVQAYQEVFGEDPSGWPPDPESAD